MDILISVLFLTNALRDTPLKSDPLLNIEAGIRAEMLCSSPFSHSGFELFNPGYRYFGENLAKNIDNPVLAWFKSPTHRVNMLSKKYQYAGVGHAICSDGTTRTVEMFGGR